VLKARPGGPRAAERGDRREVDRLIKETLPKASRIGVLFDPGSTPTQPMAAESAARLLGLQTVTSGLLTWAQESMQHLLRSTASNIRERRMQSA
jgi:hypothetical protein